MKRILCVGILMALLTGCASQQTFETITDVQDQPVEAQMQQVLLELPPGAQLQTMEPDSTDKLYLCNGFTVCLQTIQSGDLDKTLRAVTGYGEEELTLMQTTTAEGTRYRCVWAAAGEGQTQVGKTCIVDDGRYHYALTVMVPEETAGELSQTVATVMDSFQVVDAELNLNTGS